MAAANIVRSRREGGLPRDPRRDLHRPRGGDGRRTDGDDLVSARWGCASTPRLDVRAAEAERLCPPVRRSGGARAGRGRRGRAAGDRVARGVDACGAERDARWCPGRHDSALSDVLGSRLLRSGMVERSRRDSDADVPPLSVLDLAPIVEGGRSPMRFATRSISRSTPSAGATAASGSPSITTHGHRQRRDGGRHRARRGRARRRSASAPAASCCRTTRRS